QDFVRVRWRDGNRRGWTVVHPGDDTRVEEADSLYVNLSQFDKFISNRKKWGATQPWMRVRLRPGNVEFLIHGSNRPFQMNLPAPTDVLAALVNGESLLLIGKTKLWDINLEYAMEQGVENRE
ncbi:MAG: hypothetical protein GY940_04010, partial [bacterium]|nr:hypothetical protein [bacterium]